MSEGYREIFNERFKFTNHPPSEADKIEIKFEKEFSDEWMLALQSATHEVCVTNK